MNSTEHKNHNMKILDRPEDDEEDEEEEEEEQQTLNWKEFFGRLSFLMHVVVLFFLHPHKRSKEEDLINIILDFIRLLKMFPLIQLHF